MKRDPFYQLLHRCRLVLGITRPKVFAIGFNKTGTTSLHSLFESLGYTSHHGTEWRSCRAYYLYSKFDCFSDGIPVDFTYLDRNFPGSRFILQVRELDDWVCSRLAHIESEKERGAYQPAPLWDNTTDNVEAWIKQRNDHHIAVMDYFSGRPADLLTVNFPRDELAATKVSRFLGFDRDIERPKKNVNPHKRRPEHQMQMLAEASKRLGLSEEEWRCDILCPSIIASSKRDQYPHDTSML